MLKDYVTFVGIGQCGGNISNCIELNNNQVFYINTSLDDLDTIDTDYSKKYCINNVKGMAKDREYAKQTIISNDNDELVAEQIYKKYSNSHIYFFVFSLSGGTGGGMGVSLARKFKEFYPDKIINAIVVYPNSEEAILMQYNAIQCLDEIRDAMKDGVITNLQIIDNNSKEYSDKVILNSEYSDLLENLLSFNSITSSGNLDEEELERIFSTEGILNIYKLDNEDVGNNLSNLENNTIYVPFKKDCKVQGLVLSKEQDNGINRSLINESFGYPLVSHDTTWSENFSLIISAGSSFNESILNKLKDNYNSIMNKKKELESNVDNYESISIDTEAISGLHSRMSFENSQRRTRRTKEVGIRNNSRFRR